MAKTFKQGLTAIKDADFCRHLKHKEQQHRADRSYAHSQIVRFEKAFIANLKKRNIPMFSHCVCRTDEEQNRLYKKGRSKAKAGESAHNFGLATDIIHGVHAWNIPRSSWDVIGHIGKEVAAQNGIKVRWGGDWSFYDPAHWEIEDWKRKVADAEIYRAWLGEKWKTAA